MAMPVQDYLRRRDERTALEELKRDYGVNAAVGVDLVILNYDQIESKKGCPVADDCRALVLRHGTWDVVARSFRRFYNLGERPDENIDWDNSVAQDKLDGSLMLMFHDGRWRVNTRGSFAEQPMATGGPRWCDVFWNTFRAQGMSEDDFNPNYAYSFELCSPWNQVVVHHDKPSIHLLAAFDRGSGEMPIDLLSKTGADLPKGYLFDSADAARLFVESRPGNAHEGVVVKEMATGKRVKVKSTHYLHYHRLKNNGAGFSVANLVPLVLAGEADEVAAVFPEARGRIDTIRRRVAEEVSRAKGVYERSRGLGSQKEFALSILGKTPHTAALFHARKCGGTVEDGVRQAGEKVLVAMLEKEIPAVTPVG